MLRDILSPLLEESIPGWMSVSALLILAYLLFLRGTTNSKHPYRRPLGHDRSISTTAFEDDPLEATGQRFANEGIGQPQQVDVVVIGGCAAGLSTGACLDAVGVHNYVVIEKNARVGDMWRSRYQRLHLHDIIDDCHLPFLNMPETFPTYVPRLQFADYLEAYKVVNRVKVLTSHQVTRVVREKKAEGDNDEPSSRRGWIVAVQKTTSEKGATGGNAVSDAFRIRAKHVVVANGVYNEPSIPTYEGSAETFGGPIIHSSQYSNASELFTKHYGGGERNPNQTPAAVGKNILLVGYGNSGSEIALDMIEHGAKPTIIVRSAVSVVSRDWIQFLETLASRYEWVLYVPFIGLCVLPVLFLILDVAAVVVARCTFGFDLESKFGLRLRWHPPMLALIRELHPPLMDVGTINAIKAGRAVIQSSELLRLERKCAILKNGTRLTPCDAVVFATGFKSLTGHKALFEEELVEKIGSGHAAIRSGRIGFVGGEVKGEPTLWFVWNRLKAIHLMSRMVAMRICGALGKKPQRTLVGRPFRDAFVINVIAFVLWWVW